MVTLEQEAEMVSQDKQEIRVKLDRLDYLVVQESKENLVYLSLVRTDPVEPQEEMEPQEALENLDPQARVENLAQPLSEETRDHQDLMVRADLQVNLETTEPLEMTENLVHPDKLE